MVSLFSQTSDPSDLLAGNSDKSKEWEDIISKDEEVH